MEDPDGHDISQHDTSSARRDREEEVRRLKPSPPDAAGGFDVTPAHLHYVSYRLRNSQIDFSQKANGVLEQLEGYEHAGGCGTGPEAFAAAYAKVAKRFFEVWDKAVEGVGGAAVGLTMTANHYVGAEYRAHPTPGPPRTKPLPSVLAGRGYRPVPELGWGNPPEESGFGHTIINNVVGALGAVGEVTLRPVLKYALRHGKVADITPGGNDIELPKIAAAWRQAKGDAKKAADDFDGAVSYITPKSGHSEWQDAMRQFCSSIWGTTAWGQERHGYKWGRGDLKKPAVEVLMDTADELASACEGFGREVTKVRSVIEQVYIEAGKKVFEVNNFVDLLTLAGGPAEYALEFILNLDTARLNQGVDDYNSAVQTLADGLGKLSSALDEAYESIPTYAAEEARAEGFGARALNEFKQQPHYTVAGEDKDNHFYPVDLANQEGVHNSHVIDKHVGQSDAQLLNRLRDQPGIAAASTFPDLAVAQKATQDAMDEIGPADTPANAGEKNLGVNNPEKIEKWLSRPRTDNSILTLDPVEFDYTTGRTVPDGSTTASDTHSVKVVLKYKNGIDPPYVVYTSMPSQP
ncbi:RNase A-like domain-containing protein [Streptomyces sp. NPDC057116]|uniref:RNase A-like domain-containing protein n=1 Tax=Streptomyces sp. NPDC057116 TaxID=3346023 RepID=UPI003624B678